MEYFDNLVHEDGQKTFVPDWQVFVCLHATLSERRDIIQGEGHQTEDLRE